MIWRSKNWSASINIEGNNIVRSAVAHCKFCPVASLFARLVHQKKQEHINNQGQGERSQAKHFADAAFIVQVDDVQYACHDPHVQRYEQEGYQFRRLVRCSIQKTMIACISVNKDLLHLQGARRCCGIAVG